MEAAQKLHNAVGLAMKAGRIQSGDFTVERTVRAGKARLVLMDAKTSRNTIEKYQTICTNADTPLMTVPELGAAIGKPGRMLAAVTDNNFANMIRRAAEGLRVEDEGTRG